MLTTYKPDVRAVLSWTVRGFAVDYFKHLPNDYDLEVDGPNGNYITGSYNDVNSFESVNFTVSQTGNHTFRFRRSSYDDFGARMNLALVVNPD